jgi:hypothetical protein
VLAVDGRALSEAERVRFVLRDGLNTVGSDATCAISFASFPGCGVSRLHAEFSINTEASLFVLTDQGSSNGTRISAPLADCVAWASASERGALASTKLRPRMAHPVGAFALVAFGRVFCRFDCWSQRLRGFYAAYAPDKVGNIVTMLAMPQFKEAPTKLFRAVFDRYVDDVPGAEALLLPRDDFLLEEYLVLARRAGGRGAAAVASSGATQATQILDEEEDDEVLGSSSVAAGGGEFFYVPLHFTRILLTV